MPIQGSVRARAAREVRSWDMAADVVVVGFGGAGVGAAVEAASRGAETLVLERAGGPGGASGLSGGYVYAGGGTSLQKACGFEDTPENMYNFLVAATGPNPNTDKLRVYCEESVSYFDWLVSIGVPYAQKFYSEPTWQPPGEYGLVYSGGENAYPWNEIATPAPRAHIAHMPGFGGSGRGSGEAGPGSVVLKHLIAAAEKLNVRHHYDMRVDRLVEADDGRIVGVVAARYGDEVTVHARRGVVLAAGGFMNNDDMKRQHAPHLLGANLVGTEGDDGRAIRMAQSVGAAVQLMDKAECAFGLHAPLLVRSMIVNLQGQRFVNEDTYPGRVGQAILMRQNRRAFAVFDLESHEVAVPAGTTARRAEPTWVAETLAELEQLAGIAEGGLESSVGYYNKYAAGGRDPMFRKNPKWLKPLHAPFGAIDIGSDVFSSFSCFTLGGLVTPPSGEVIDVDGDPIPGLYAAGRTVSGIPASGYLSGSSLGDSIFFGRKAGISAAAPA